jgi:hypothetical protein
MYILSENIAENQSAIQAYRNMQLIGERVIEEEMVRHVAGEWLREL